MTDEGIYYVEQDWGLDPDCVEVDWGLNQSKEFPIHTGVVWECFTLRFGIDQRSE